MIAADTITPLRALGGAFALLLLAWTVVRFRRRTISRASFLILGVLSVAIIVMAVAPSLFGPLFRAFNFQKGNQRQLIAALLFAVFVLFALNYRTTSELDANRVSIRQLIEALTMQTFDWSAADTLLPGDRVVIVMPAYNEADNIGAVLAEMPPEIEGLPAVTLVVDDASEDDTSAIAHKEGALVARLPIRRGQGMALRVGYEIGLKLGGVVICSLDADGQHVPAELPLVVGPVLRGEADMVVGSRKLGAYEKESHIRHAGVFILSGLVSLLHGQRLTDVSSGFRATSAETMRRLNLQHDQYSSEVLVEALRHKAHITEVPITVRARLSGVSKKPSSLKYGWRFTKVIFETWLR